MTNNLFNYPYTSIEKLMLGLERLIPRTKKLASKGLFTEMKIDKSKYGYWNLKLRIYDKEGEHKEARVFSNEAGNDATN